MAAIASAIVVSDEFRKSDTEKRALHNAANDKALALFEAANAQTRHFLQWPGLLVEMQHECTAWLDDWSRISLALTCRDHYARFLPKDLNPFSRCSLMIQALRWDAEKVDVYTRRIHKQLYDPDKETSCYSGMFFHVIYVLLDYRPDYGNVVMSLLVYVFRPGVLEGSDTFREDEEVFIYAAQLGYTPALAYLLRRSLKTSAKLAALRLVFKHEFHFREDIQTHVLGWFIRWPIDLAYAWIVMPDLVKLVDTIWHPMKSISTEQFIAFIENFQVFVVLTHALMVSLCQSGDLSLAEWRMAELRRVASQRYFNLDDRGRFTNNNNNNNSSGEEEEEEEEEERHTRRKRLLPQHEYLRALVYCLREDIQPTLALCCLPRSQRLAVLAFAQQQRDFYFFTFRFGSLPAAASTGPVMNSGNMEEAAEEEEEEEKEDLEAGTEAAKDI